MRRAWFVLPLQPDDHVLLRNLRVGVAGNLAQRSRRLVPRISKPVKITLPQEVAGVAGRAIFGPVARSAFPKQLGGLWGAEF